MYLSLSNDLVKTIKLFENVQTATIPFRYPTVNCVVKVFKQFVKKNLKFYTLTINFLQLTTALKYSWKKSNKLKRINFKIKICLKMQEKGLEGKAGNQLQIKAWVSNPTYRTKTQNFKCVSEQFMHCGATLSPWSSFF